MARQARKKSIIGTYNVILRSDKDLFLDDADYEYFLELMDKYLYTIYGFSLTKNVICMVLGESNKGISFDIKPLSTSYARYYNKKYVQDGKLFYDRFKSEPINDKSQIPNCAAVAAHIPDILGVEGYISENTDENYEMIPFYDFNSTVQKPKQKKAAVPSLAKEKKSEEPKASQKKQKQKLPSWLL